MKTREYDVAVIGGGHNGLICAAYLARTGLRVCVLEARHECGGGLDTLEFGGFRYNPHAIFHMMAEIMPAYQDLGLVDRGVKFIYPEVQAAYVSRDHPPLVLYRDPEKTAQYIGAAFSPADGDAYRRMISDFQEFSEKILIPCTYVPAVPPVDQVRTLIMARDDVGKRFNEVADHTPLQILESYGFQEPVKAGILNLFAMWGLSPDEALGYIFPLYVYRMTRAALCKGGSHRLSSGLHRATLEAGGEILDKAEVVRVLLSQGRVEGVVTRDGTEIRARAVASTVDPRQNFLRFFEKGEIPEELTDSAEGWQWEKSSLFGVHLALREAPRYAGTESCQDANRALVTFLGVSDSEAVLEHDRQLEQGKIPSRLLGHTTVASLFDPLMAPPGFHSGRWESQVPFDGDWDRNKHEFARRCVEEWKSYAPNLDPISTLVYPPDYIEKKMINMVRGSIKQGAYVPLQMGYFRPNEHCSGTSTPIPGFYVCGASVYPGGMVIGGPGYVGANVIAQDLEVKKTWAEPEIVRQARERGIIED
jgi:phytoene dehydrogenase-like protein